MVTDAVVVDASGWDEAARKRVTSSIVVVVTVHARRRDGARSGRGSESRTYSRFTKEYGSREESQMYERR